MPTATQPEIRDLLDMDFAWTPRQREVLDRITQGKSNHQIADELGVSLDGAKWHMREILSKLNLETREDAAEYWRLYNGWKPRLARASRGLANATALKWVGAVGVVAVAVAGGALVYAALSGDDEPDAGQSIENTPTPETTTPSTTPAATAAPTTAPTPAATQVARTVVLDSQPRQQPPETTRVLGTPPDSAFPPWDGVSTVIYDIEKGITIDLGPGAQPAAFSPDETMAVWTVGNQFGQGTEAWLIELSSGVRRSLGPANFAGFASDGRIVVSTGSGRFAVDPKTGTRTPAADSDTTYYTTSPEPQPGPPYVIAPAGPTNPDLRSYTVSDRATGHALLNFEAVAATPAGRSTVAAVSGVVAGRANVYLIDITTGSTTFVATVNPGNSNFPFSATDDAVLWTDGYCPDNGGMVTLFERSTGQLTALDLSAARPDNRWAQLTPAGDIAVGSFGADLLLDRDSLAVLAGIPPRADGAQGDISWSANYKFASHGAIGGHGGLCV